MLNLNTKTPSLKHGGNLEYAIAKYGIPREQWLDLSTGISPWSYPCSNIPAYIWQNLPQSNTALIAAASRYYSPSSAVEEHSLNNKSILAVPGSQIAIRLLPQLFEASTVAVPKLGYKEHAASWQMASHETINYSNMDELQSLINNQLVEHVVLINPNNPSGDKLSLETIGNLASATNGAFIIDEAFIDQYDSTDTASATALALSQMEEYQNIIVLRSIGKFFGLAGIRLGFIISSNPKVTLLNTLLEPWSISHASQYIGIKALEDAQWQLSQRERIDNQQHAFKAVLTKLFNTHLKEFSHTEAGLFNTVFADKKSLEYLHLYLAKKGIWTRLGNEEDKPSWLRFGLAKDIEQFENLAFN